MAIAIEMKQLIFSACFIFCTCAYPAMSRTLHESSVAKIHEQWMFQYGRSYADNIKKEKRLKIFMENLEYIENFNSANKSYKLGINKFSDLTVEEFIASNTGLKISSQTTFSSKVTPVAPLNLSEIPKSTDWSEQGAVTNVKHQLACAMSRTLHESSVAKIHEQWMFQYGRSYADNIEKEKRLKIFMENMEYIENFNRANKSYKLGINKFSDLTMEEFIASNTGLKISSQTSFSSKVSPVAPLNLSEIPKSIDWREQGAVTNVKHQLACGSCWAFSAVAAIEGILKIKTGKLVSLSEQQLVDCTEGCGDGWMDDAFNYIIQKNGIASETDYPYQGVVQTCQNDLKPSGHIRSFVDVPSNNEEQLLHAVAKQPVSVSISINEEFRSYKQGIFTGPCGTNLNHGVTLVGYGTSEDGTKYWLIKNSWGESWGEGGYMRLLRGSSQVEGLCGIAMKASYPTA